MQTTLESWLAAEAAQRERLAAGVGPGVAMHASSPAMSGLEALQAMLRGELPYPTIGPTMDCLLIEVSPGHAVFQGRPGPGHLNPMGGVHGGWYATILDSALGCCVQAALPAGKAYTTLELKVNLVRAIRADTVRVRAEGRVIHLGGQTATADARLVGPDGKLYAHGSTTCLIFEPRGAAAR